MGNNVIANSPAINENTNTIGSLITSVDAIDTDIGNLQKGVTPTDTAIVSAASNLDNVHIRLNTNKIVITPTGHNISDVQVRVLVNGTAITGTQGNVIIHNMPQA